LRSQGNRVTLSGIGGSEFLGDGVPTPRQEFQDLLATTRFLTLSRQLKAWAAKMRKPRLPLLWEAMRGFFSPASTILQEDIRACPWFYPGFVSRNRAALGGYQSRVKLFGALPSFRDNIDTLEYVRRLQEVYVLSPKSLYEKRYPYLDSELLEFVFAIPREQIVGVGQRRYLAKRALVGIIPGELLNRRKKAAVPQEPKKPSPIGSPSLLEIGQHIVGGAVGIIAPDRFLKAVQKAQHNKEVPVDCLRRTLLLESWLRHLATRGVLTTSVATKRKSYSSAPETQGFQMPSQPQRFS
jgi:asparagine synthase (glutamine-hydrolysing)